MNKDVVALLNLGTDNEGAVAGGSSHEETGGILERPALGDRQQAILSSAELRSKGALGGTKDARADGISGRLGVLGGGDDFAGKLGAGYPREGYKRRTMSVYRANTAKGNSEGCMRTRLVLVFSLHLENVEEVGGGRVHLDDILVVLGGRIGQLSDFELARAL